jgi:hypothetical protein
MSILDEIKKAKPDLAPAIDAAVYCVPYVGQAYAAIKYGKEILEFLGILSGPDDLDKEILNQLKIVMNKLDGVLKAIENQQIQGKRLENQIERLTIFNDASDLQTAGDSAYYYCKYGGEENRHAYQLQRGIVELNIGHFLHNDSYWESVYIGDLGNELDPYPGVYYDKWSGTFIPILYEGGTCYWDYRIALPAYLAGLNYWWACILASRDKLFVDARSDLMKLHIEKLNWVLNTILDSYQGIRPPEPHELKWMTFMEDSTRYVYWWDWPGELPHESSIEDANELQNVITLVEDNIPGGKWRSINRAYGMVEENTGWYIRNNYPYNMIKQVEKYVDWNYGEYPGKFRKSRYSDAISTSYDVNTADEYPVFYEKFTFLHLLRTWRSARRLSRDLNLLGLRTFTEQYCRYVNYPVSLLPEKWYQYVVVSMRSLCDNLPDSVKSSMGHPVSLRNLAQALSSLLGYSMPASLRRIILLGDVTLVSSELTIRAPSASLYNDNLNLFVNDSNSCIATSYFNSLGAWSGWQKVSSGAHTSEAIATVNFNDKLYLFFIATNLRVLEYIYYDMAWNVEEVPGGGFTVDALAAAVFNNKIYLFSRGIDVTYDNRIYVNICTYDAEDKKDNWSGASRLPGEFTTDVYVAAIAFCDKLYLFAKGLSNLIYFNIYDTADNWSGWWKVPGEFVTDVPVAAIVYKNRLCLFAVGSDNLIYSNSCDAAGNWSRWSEVPCYYSTNTTNVAVTTHVAASAIVFNDSIYLFITGTDSSLYLNILDLMGTSWTLL